MTFISDITDPIFGFNASVGFFGEVNTCQRTILLGKLPTSPLDTQQWALNTASGGYLSSSSNFMLGSGPSSGSVFLSSSHRSILQPSTVNVANFSAQFNNTGSAGNVRTIGPYDASDGVFVELSESSAQME